MGSPSFLSMIFATAVFIYWGAEPPTPPSASGARGKEEYRGGVKVNCLKIFGRQYVPSALMYGHFVTGCQNKHVF